MYPFLADLLRSLQLADIADVLLVALFLFVGISWLRGSTSGSAARRMLVLGALLAAVYFLADVGELYLMRAILRFLLFAFLIAAVVLFQSDVRRLLDRLASWAERRREPVYGAAAVETLMEVAYSLSEKKVGAIIAVRGRDQWHSYIQAGVRLDGLVSRPLLESIFQPESPGHDGAVLMEGDRVLRFAAHLPLGARVPEVSRYGGTRHAAALGLADETDAFVIVVSEERGAISVAERGELTEIESIGELAERLTTFWQRNYLEAAEGPRGWRNRSVTETALLALGGAGLIWLLFAYSVGTISRTFQVPIEFRNVPPGWTLRSDSVPAALVTLTGSERAFARLDPSDVSISFDLAAADSGLNLLAVTDRNLRLPAGLQLTDVVPGEVRVELLAQIEAQLPVEVKTLGTVPDSLFLLVRPGSVTVLVEGRGVPPPYIPTLPVDIARLLRVWADTISLELPPGVRLAEGETGRVVVGVGRR